MTGQPRQMVDDMQKQKDDLDALERNLPKGRAIIERVRKYAATHPNVDHHKIIQMATRNLEEKHVTTYFQLAWKEPRSLTYVNTAWKAAAEVTKDLMRKGVMLEGESALATPEPFIARMGLDDLRLGVANRLPAGPLLECLITLVISRYGLLICDTVCPTSCEDRSIGHRRSLCV
ncbi:MAG: hypothetical protein ABIE25_06360 [Thermoplasmatota archaeon]